MESSIDSLMNPLKEVNQAINDATDGKFDSPTINQVNTIKVDNYEIYPNYLKPSTNSDS